MKKLARATKWALLCAPIAPFTCQPASAATMYSVVETHAVNSIATGVDKKGNVLTTAPTKQKGKVHSAFCRDWRPTCDSLGVKFGGAWHDARYVSLVPNLPPGGDIVAVGQVYVKGEWYATYKYGFGRSRFHNDAIITPGIAYGAGSGNGVVGETSQHEAFHYKTRVLTILPTLGGAEGSARAVNGLGTIVGDSTNAQGLRRATMWSAGVPQDMGVLADGGQHSTARSINDAGVAVGCADKGAELKRVAAKFEAGAVVDLGALNFENGNEACATIISDKGVIAGWSTVLPGEGTHAFVIDGGTMVDLNDLITEADQALYELVDVGGANSKGQLAVSARRRADSANVVLLLTRSR